MSLSECYFAHAGKYGKPVDRVPARENLRAPRVKAASNRRFDVSKNLVVDNVAVRSSENKLATNTYIAHKQITAPR